MSELKFPKAAYRDETGKLFIIRAEELAKINILELARLKAKLSELFDETEQVRLTPHFGDVKVPHFVSKHSLTRRLLQGKSDESHDARVNHLVGTLNGRDYWDLGMLGPKKANNEPRDFSRDFVLSEYEWDDEVQRIMDENTIVQHDVFGGTTKLSMSIRQPAIAIEVINTHYPEEEAFNAFLEKSKREPFIVFFDVIRYKGESYNNTFLKVDPKLGRISYERYTFLVREGGVYKGRKLTDIKTSTRLKIEIENMIDSWKQNSASKSLTQ